MTVTRRSEAQVLGRFHAAEEPSGRMTPPCQRLFANAVTYCPFYSVPTQWLPEKRPGHSADIKTQSRAGCNFSSTTRLRDGLIASAATGYETVLVARDTVATKRVCRLTKSGGWSFNIQYFSSVSTSRAALATGCVCQCQYNVPYCTTSVLTIFEPQQLFICCNSNDEYKSHWDAQLEFSELCRYEKFTQL